MPHLDGKAGSSKVSHVGETAKSRWLGIAAGVAVGAGITAAALYATGSAQNETNQPSKVARHAYDAQPPSGGITVSAGGYTGQALAWGGGAVILNPQKGLPNGPTSGTGWVFKSGEIDAQAVLSDIKNYLKLTDKAVNCGAGSVCSFDEDGTSFVIGIDPLRKINGFISKRTDRSCTGTADEVSACQERYSGEAPSKEDAIAQSQDFMRAVGQDPQQYSWTAFIDGDNSTKVIATLTLDGQQLNDYSWILDVSSFGLYSITGFLAPAEQSPGYLLVTATQAALRARQTQWAGTGPVPVWEVAADNSLQANPQTAPLNELLNQYPTEQDVEAGLVGGKPTVALGTKLYNAVNAQLGLKGYRTSTNQIALLPTWIYTTDDGTQWAVLALDDKYLD